MEHGTGIGAKVSEEENTGLFRRPARPSLAGMPLGPGWIDEAIALLDDLESEPVAIGLTEGESAEPEPERALEDDFEIDIVIEDEDRVDPLEATAAALVPTAEAIVITTRPVMSTPAPAPRRRTSPLSYMGAVKPFMPARNNWRPGAGSRALA